MPRDGSGNYSLPATNPVANGTLIDIAWANGTMSDLATQLNNVITRDQLLATLADINANNYRLKNLNLGTAGSPAVSAQGGSGTGMWFPAIDSLALSSGGTERIRVDSTGCVVPGVLTAGPVYLTRADASAEGGQINFKRALDNADAYAIDVLGSTTTPNLRILDVGAGLTRMTLNGVGQFGFADDAPTYQVTIGGTGQEVGGPTDAGAKGASIFLRATGVTAGSGGAVFFGTTFGNKTPFAAIKGFVQNGGSNSTGDLVLSTRRQITDVALTEGARLTAAGKFGIGVPVPIDMVSISDGTITAQIKQAGSTTFFGNRSSHDIAFTVNDIERMRLSGTVLSTSAGVSIQNSGGNYVGATGDTAYSGLYGGASYDRGAGVVCYGQSSTAPNVLLFTRGAFIESARIDANGHLLPGANGTYAFGSTSLRWSQVWCTAGAFNTSDARLKTKVQPFSPAEIAASKALSKEIGLYQWLEAIELKGADGARQHIGLTVQRAAEVLESFGLDPWKYGFMSYDKWEDTVVHHPAIQGVAAQDAVYAENGTELSPAILEVKACAARDEVTLAAGESYAFRYDQLTLFITRGLAARIEALENPA